MARITEAEVLARIAQRFPAAASGEVWIGDDAAVLRPVPGEIVVSTDVTVAGVHLDLSLATTADLGWKAVATALSDLAAMGADPVCAVVAVAADPDCDFDGLFDGIDEAACAHQCPVVGGDLSAGPGLAVVVTVFGQVVGAVGRGPVLRSGARPGDTIFASAALGASAAGLRLLREGADRDEPAARSCIGAHLRPRARLAEGACARMAGVHAMIDVSDGLALDLDHVASASGVGIVLDTVPVAQGATQDEAMHGGEDYELAFTADDPAGLVHAFTDAGLAAPVPIGRCSADPAERVLSGRRFTPGGWEHIW